MTTQNPWDAAKAVIRGSLQQYNPTSRNKKKHQIDNLNLHLKQLEQEKQKKNWYRERYHKDLQRNK